MRTNLKPLRAPVHAAQGAPADPSPPLEELRRAVLSCLLWEDTFYEAGTGVAARIKALVPKVPGQAVADLAIEAREVHNLRHVSLFLLRELARYPSQYSVSSVLARVIKRADELAEFMAMYWKEGRSPIAKQVKKGLAAAFRKFDAYQLAKYNRPDAIKLRDVAFLVHPRSARMTEGQLDVKSVPPIEREGYKRGPVYRHKASTLGQLIEGTLPSPETWENRLSAGADKKATFEAMLREESLGYMALLRNLRNMTQANVDPALVKAALLARKGADKVLPFRFIAAAKAAPKYEADIDAAMVASLSHPPKLPGKTLVVLDVSGSMYGKPVSAKSDMDRALAACALGAILREVCEEPVIYATAGSDAKRVHATQLVPARRGMALVDAVHGLCHPLGGGWIFLHQVMEFLHKEHGSADRVIVITDEVDCGGRTDAPGNARIIGKTNYINNVATEKHGVGYQKWTHINGFSEGVVRYIFAEEAVAERTQGAKS